MSVATSVMADEVGGWFFIAASWTFLITVSALVTVLVARTATAMIRGQICVPE